MAAKWIETVAGSLEQKRQYREYKARVQRLPADYRTAVEALERYLSYFSAITKEDVLVTMLNDLGELFEQAAADETPVRAIVGADPVEFVEAFLANYSEGQWINKERTRLINAINGISGISGSDG